MTKPPANFGNCHMNHILLLTVVVVMLGIVVVFAFVVSVVTSPFLFSLSDIVVGVIVTKPMYIVECKLYKAIKPDIQSNRHNKQIVT